MTQPANGHILLNRCDKLINADYDVVAEAEAILADAALINA